MEKVTIRVPGRVNLLGMHIDHQGGQVNPITFGHMYIDVKPCKDYKLKVASTEFGEVKLVDFLSHKDWYIHVQVVVEEYSDFLRCSGYEGIEVTIVSIESSVPPSRGLGSSSSVVVGTYAALRTLLYKTFSTKKKDLMRYAERCAAIERNVGTKGGSGDHLAILFGKRGRVSHLQGEGERVSIKYTKFPSEYNIILCDSGVTATKSAGAKDIFNARVACYSIAEQMLHRVLRTSVAWKSHWRANVSTIATQLDAITIAQLASKLPIHMSRSDIEKEGIEIDYSTHIEPQDGYNVKGVFQFGVAECLRSKLAQRYLKKDIIKFGELMFHSHAGDRTDTNDSILDVHEVTHLTPGKYDAGHPLLDEIVDIAKQSGCIGACRVGAGLGGCVAILVSSDITNRVTSLLESKEFTCKVIESPEEGMEVIEVK